MSPWRSRRLALLSCLLLLPLAGAAGAEEAAQASTAEPEGGAGVVRPGSRISMEYTVKLDDGSVVDTNAGKKPLEFAQGDGRILPALDRALLGMKVNESRRVDLSAAEAYGEVKPDAYRRVPLLSLPEEARKEGMKVGMRDDKGRRHRMRVHKIDGDQAVLDMNHPLAGKALHFDVKILAVE